MTIECKVSGKYLNIWQLKERIEQGDSSVDTIIFYVEDYVDGYPFKDWSWWLRYKTSLSNGTLIKLDDEYDEENKRVKLTWKPTSQTFTYFTGSVELQLQASYAAEEGLLKWNSNTSQLRIGQNVDLEYDDEKVTPDLFEQYLEEFEKLYSGVAIEFKKELEEFINTKQEFLTKIENEVNRATTKENEIEEKINNIPDISSHINDFNNPHKVTKSQIGLSQVDNTSDLNKPVSNAQEQRIKESESKIEDESIRAKESEEEIKHYINTLYNTSADGSISSGIIDTQIKEETRRATNREDEIEEKIKDLDVSKLREDLNEHIEDKNNPHQVTSEQINAISKNELGVSIPTLNVLKKVDDKYLPFNVYNFEYGYYKDGEFYLDSSYKKVLTKSVYKLYIDKSTDELYYYSDSYIKCSSDVSKVLLNYYTKIQVDELLSNKVDKIKGKQLTTNDFTTILKNKLENLNPDANENVIESISLDGSKLPIDLNKNVNITIPEVEIPVKSVSVNKNKLTPDDQGNVNIDITEQEGIKGVSLNGKDVEVDSRSYAQLNIDYSEEINKKVDKEEGKGLSSEDYTKEEKDKLTNIENYSERNVLVGIKYNNNTVNIDVNRVANINVSYDDELNDISENAVQNKIINSKFQAERTVSQNMMDSKIQDYKKEVNTLLSKKVDSEDMSTIDDSIIDAQFED